MMSVVISGPTISAPRMQLNRCLAIVRSTLLAVFGSWGALASIFAQAAALPPVLPEQEEISAALEGAPAHLREQAGVFILRAKGYERIRESSNGFNCLLVREWARSFEPTCFDDEGSKTILPVVLYQVELRANGKSDEEIDAAVAVRYASGEFRAPQRVGIAYMLSNRNIVVTDRKQKRVGPAPPHLMFYSPYATAAELGTNDHFDSHFGVADEGTPRAMIIVPVATQSSEHKHN
jgi:hypothetical protein